jgi:hypothetical protein
MPDDTDFATQKSLVVAMLNNSQGQFDAYQQMKTAQSSSIRQREELENEKNRLQSELANARKDAEAYDREFLDRTRAGMDKPSRTAAYGISTLQDWVLFLFYISYAAATIALAAFVGLRAQHNKIVGVVGVLLGSAFLGILFSMVIVRFA